MGARTILCYNAIPMPHSVLLHEKLEEAGYRVWFWYYGELTEVYPWDTLDAKVSYRVMRNSLGDVRRLTAEIKEADLLIVSGWHTLLHVASVLFGKMIQRKVAVWMDAPLNVRHPSLVGAKRMLLGVADYVLVTGRSAGRKVQETYRVSSEKVRDFPYLGLEPDEVRCAAVNARRGRELEMGDRIRVLIASRFEPRKGYAVVHEALSLLDSTVTRKFRFTVIGAGTEYGKYCQLFGAVDAEVEVLKWLAYEEYKDRLYETDVLIHPSLHEPFGIPPVDAMALGKLVIASSGVYSCLDRLRSGENGYLFEAGSASALAAILRVVAADVGLVYRLGRSAKDTAKGHSFVHNLEVIDEIMREPSRRVGASGRR